MMLWRLQHLTRGLGLPPGLWAGPDGTGLVVRSQWGAVCWLGWCVEGRPDESWALTLRPWLRAGVLRTPRGSGGTEDREVYRWGRVEVFDAWSDNLRPTLQGWMPWTRRATLIVLSRVRCGLCGERLGHCQPAATDPEGRRFVCASCLRQAGPAATRAWPLGRRECAFCGEDQHDDARIHEGRAGCLCVPCMVAAQVSFHGR